MRIWPHPWPWGREQAQGGRNSCCKPVTLGPWPSSLICLPEGVGGAEKGLWEANPFGHCPRACPCPWALASTSCYQSFFVWSRSQSLWDSWSQDTLILNPEQIRAGFGDCIAQEAGSPGPSQQRLPGGWGLLSRDLDLVNTGLLPAPRPGKLWPEAQ